MDKDTATYIRYKSNYYKTNFKGHSLRKVPAEIRTLWVAKRLRISYKQARGSIDRLIKSGVVTKYTKYSKGEDKYSATCYYIYNNHIPINR